jgi:membrane protein YdbS with pleckstrin-like domain
MQLSKLIKQKEYERIEYALRRHPITLVPIIILSILLLLIPVGLYVMVNNLFPELITNDRIYPIFVLGISTYLLSVYLFIFAYFIDFYLDIWIVTNDRIIDIEQFGLFSRTISELELFRIQDVTTNVHGFFPTMFNYGNITVKTASQNISIIFKNVRNPNFIRQKVIQLAAVDRKFHVGQDVEHHM